MSRRFFASILISLTLFFSEPYLVLAQDAYGLDSTAGAAGIPTSKSITTILGDVIGTALSLVSVLFFGLMLYAGIKWMLARGDEGEATKALDTIIAAVIGLVVVLASYAITTFVFKSVGGNGGGDGGGGGSTPSAGGKCVVWHEKDATVAFCKQFKDEATCKKDSWCGWDNGCGLAVQTLEEAKSGCPKIKNQNECDKSTLGCEWK